MKVTKRQAKEIRALKRLRDERIDLTDIPPLRNWSKAVIGKFYRPRKKSLTIRIDADVLAWHLDVGIDKRFLGDLAEIRLAVEPRAAALAAARRTEADVAELPRPDEAD